MNKPQNFTTPKMSLINERPTGAISKLKRSPKILDFSKLRINENDPFTLPKHKPSMQESTSYLESKTNRFFREGTFPKENPTKNLGKNYTYNVSTQKSDEATNWQDFSERAQSNSNNTYSFPQDTKKDQTRSIFSNFSQNGKLLYTRKIKFIEQYWLFAKITNTK